MHEIHWFSHSRHIFQINVLVNIRCGISIRSVYHLKEKVSILLWSKKYFNLHLTVPQILGHEKRQYFNEWFLQKNGSLCRWVSRCHMKGINLKLLLTLNWCLASWPFMKCAKCEPHIIRLIIRKYWKKLCQNVSDLFQTTYFH